LRSSRALAIRWELDPSELSNEEYSKIMKEIEAIAQEYNASEFLVEYFGPLMIKIRAISNGRVIIKKVELLDPKFLDQPD
jgi:hypothetical protein